MRNIFVTGSSGYLGTRLIEKLAAGKHAGTIVGADIVAPRKTAEKTVFLKMDIRDPGMDRILSRHLIDTLLHLACVVQPIHDLKRMHAIDYHGTRNVLQSAHEAGIKHIVAISSTLAYGAHPDNPVELKEEDPLRGNRRFPYGYNKARVDEMIQAFAASHPDMAITILRPCTVFGPTVDNYVSRMLFRPWAAAVMGYDPQVQFVHEDDFVKACLNAVEKKIGGTFNIVGSGTVAAKQVASMIGLKRIPLPAFILYPLVELLWHIRFPGVEVGSGYLDYARYPFVASPRKAAAELDFTPNYSSHQVLQDALRHRYHAERQRE